MTARASIARRIGLGTAALCATLLTASCAAGQHAETAEENPTIDGSNASVGSMLLRTVAIVSPSSKCYLPGADAAMSMSIVNTGQSPDSLTAVSSPRFSAYEIVKTTSELAPVQGSGSCTDTAAPAPGSSSSAPSGSSSGGTETVDAGKAVHMGVLDTGTTKSGEPTTPVLVLSGLHGGPLFAGESVPVTFTFADAGQVTVQVPVQLGAAPPPSIVPSVPNPSVTPIE